MLGGSWCLFEGRQSGKETLWITIAARMSFVEAFVLMGEYASNQPTKQFKIALMENTEDIF